MYELKIPKHTAYCSLPALKIISASQLDHSFVGQALSVKSCQKDVWDVTSGHFAINVSASYQLLGITSILLFSLTKFTT